MADMCVYTHLATSLQFCALALANSFWVKLIPCVLQRSVHLDQVTLFGHSLNGSPLFPCAGGALHMWRSRGSGRQSGGVRHPTNASPLRLFEPISRSPSRSGPQSDVSLPEWRPEPPPMRRRCLLVRSGTKLGGLRWEERPRARGRHIGDAIGHAGDMRAAPDRNDYASGTVTPGRVVTCCSTACSECYMIPPRLPRHICGRRRPCRSWRSPRRPVRLGVDLSPCQDARSRTRACTAARTPPTDYENGDKGDTGGNGKWVATCCVRRGVRTGESPALRACTRGTHATSGDDANDGNVDDEGGNDVGGGG